MTGSRFPERINFWHMTIAASAGTMTGAVAFVFVTGWMEANASNGVAYALFTGIGQGLWLGVGGFPIIWLIFAVYGIAVGEIALALFSRFLPFNFVATVAIATISTLPLTALFWQYFVDACIVFCTGGATAGMLYYGLVTGRI
jgi:hypothetical protein